MAFRLEAMSREEVKAVEEILSMRGVYKSFPGVKALDGVNFSCNRGEVHALLGHNGAGKSTLIKILGGIYRADRGKVTWQSRPFKPIHPMDATSAGISIIHQEFNLIPDQTVAQNIFLGREPRTCLGFLKKKDLYLGAAEVLERLKIKDISPLDYIRDLSVNQLQLVEIAKTLSVKASLIVMDEPTAALPLPDVKKLFEIINNLKARGVTVIYISHRLEEIFAVCDRVTLMKDGKMLATLPVEGLSRDMLVERMAGKSIVEFFPRRSEANDGKTPILSLKAFKSTAMSYPVTFDVNEGEIFGITGLEGCGATDIVRGLFGIDKKQSGEIYLHGDRLQISSPRGALAAGIGFLTKDRRNEGLILTSSLGENMVIPLREISSKIGLLNFKNESKLVHKMMAKLDIKAPNIDQEVQFLSGGNQQKIILAKWLLINCRLLIVDEPTRGVDVGTKAEIYRLLRELVDQGIIVVVVSSDMEEILGLCDRLLVLHRGDIKANLSWDKASEYAVLQAATGQALDANASLVQS
jgi:ribose transport system ATP-binding protein